MSFKSFPVTFFFKLYNITGLVLESILFFKIFFCFRNYFYFYVSDIITETHFIIFSLNSNPKQFSKLKLILQCLDYFFQCFLFPDIIHMCPLECISVSISVLFGSATLVSVILMVLLSCADLVKS